MSDALRSKVCAWLVTDSRGAEALFKNRMRAENYVTPSSAGTLTGSYG